MASNGTKRPAGLRDGRIAVLLAVAWGCGAAASDALAQSVSKMPVTTGGGLALVSRPVPTQGYRGLSEITVEYRGSGDEGVSAPQGAEPLRTIGGSADPGRAGQGMVAIYNDDTLRSGDVVMFPAGPKLFRPTIVGPPWSGDDFADVTGAKGLSKAVQARLSSLVGRSVAPPAEADRRDNVDSVQLTASTTTAMR